MIDIHIHSTNSSDGRSSIEEYLIKAIEMGITTLGFSEHVDFDCVKRGIDYNPLIDMPKYAENISEMREKYKGKIEILFGIEVSFDELANEENSELIKTYPFDYVINSVHLIEDEDMWLSPYFEKRTKKEAYDRYLDYIYKSLSAPYPFHTVAHLGYVVRKAPYKEKDFTLKEFGEKLDKILKKMIEKGVALEINSSTRCDYDYFPPKDVLKRYIELGGNKVTYGSDSHDTTRLNDGHDKIQADLKELGLKHTVHFEKGELIKDFF